MNFLKESNQITHRNYFISYWNDSEIPYHDIFYYLSPIPDTVHTRTMLRKSWSPHSVAEIHTTCSSWLYSSHMMCADSRVYHTLLYLSPSGFLSLQLNVSNEIHNRKICSQLYIQGLLTLKICLRSNLTW